MVKVNCDYCGKEIKKKPSEVHGHNFCNREHFNKYRKQNFIPTQRKGNKIVEKKSHIIVYASNDNSKILADKDCIDKIKKYTWQNKKGYAVTEIQKSNNRTTILMHRLIMGPPENKLIDHINHKTLDNRKQNLRVVSHSQNLMNSKHQTRSKSKVRGVNYVKRDDLWRARIQIDGERIHLGWYKEREEAVKARKEAEQKYYGEYAYSG